MTELLEVREMNHHFGGLKAVDGVTFSVKEHMVKAVIGPNGAGKTTLFNLISGSIIPDSGEVVFKGDMIQGLPPYRIARLGISRTFQHIRLFPKMTALENVMIGRHIHSRAGFIAGMLNLPWTWREGGKVREHSLEMMAFLGISHLADVDAKSLSYGQQRSVELARALACDPRLLLLDEPAAGLNIRETREIGKIILKIRERDVTVLIVDHDMSLVMNISDEIVVLSYGQKIADDVPQTVQKDEEVIRVYLGEEDA